MTQMEKQLISDKWDEERKKRYLKRASNIRGNWKNNPYSPNNLSLHILWN